MLQPLLRVGALMLLSAGCATTASLSPADMTAFEVSLAASGPQRIGVAWFGSTRDSRDAIYLRFVDARGRPQGKPLRLTDGSRHAYEPSLQFLQQDPVVAWYEKDYAGRLQAMVARFSADGGRRWIRPLSPPEVQGRIPVIRVADDQVHVAWLEQADDTRDENVRYARLDADGAWLESPQIIGAASHDTWNLNAALDAGGRFYVVYDARSGAAAKELHLLRIDTGGVRSSLLSADDGVDSVYPDLALQGDRAALTWFDSRDGNREVYLYAGPVSELDRPIDGHAVRVTQTPGASIGAYVSWNAGRIGLAWCDNSGGHQRVFIQSFDQNGSALRPAVPLTDGRLEGLIPSIIPWRNGFAVGWNERLAAPGLHGHASTISSFAALRLLPAGTAPMPVPQSITQAVANPDRPAADRERDTRDRPVEVLAFLGLRPGMRVFDLNAATGYYTEILARAVGPAGHVIAHNHPGATAMLGEAALTQRYKQQRLPNVELLTARHAELRLEPGSLDMVLMSMVYHDTYWQEPGVDWGPIDQQALLREFFAALRPGGIVGVIDHVADAGTDPRTVAHALHRIDPEVVKRDFARAGFVLEAESNALRRAGDDHRLGVFDPAIVGRTDRFVMRFRRP